MRVSESNGSFWSPRRALAIVGAIGAATLTGYVSGGVAGANSRPQAVQVAQAEAPAPEATSKARLVRNEAEPQDRNGSSAKSDPVEDYRAALNLLKKNYYGAPVDDKKTRELTYAAIRGMLGSLKDQYTGFLDPSEWDEMRQTTDGDFEGIGAVLSPEKGEIRVFELFEGGPAEKAGIKPDDVIVRVNNESVIGKELTEVVKKIKGPRRTQVRVSVLRNKKQLDFTITRARVETPVIKWNVADYENKVGYIHLKEFNKRSVEQMRHAFDELKRVGVNALVLDLRYNPGGLLDKAVEVASVFIPEDTNPEFNNTVVTIRGGPGKETSLKLQGDLYMANKMPLVVLVNQGSASASEIVSSAIKDYGVGLVIGERTYGKGKVQTLFDLHDGSALRLTTANYFPPRGEDINFKIDAEGVRIKDTGGIEPDIIVKPAEDWKGPNLREQAKDVQLQKGLTFLRARLRGMTVAQAAEVTKKP